MDTLHEDKYTFVMYLAECGKNMVEPDRAQMTNAVHALCILDN
jgi:hypothetical protein